MLQPVTKGNEISAEINRILSSARTYDSVDEITFRRLEVQAKKVVSANPVEGHNVLASLYGLRGDIAKAREHFSILANLSQEPILATNKTAILLNAGFFGEVQKLFAIAANPQMGFFTGIWDHGIACGAFRTLHAFLSTARKMELDLKGINVDLVERAVRFLDANAISDESLAAMLDVAGEMLRENRLFFIGRAPTVFVGDHDSLESFFEITFQVGLSGKAAAALDRELGHRLLTRLPDMPFEVMLHFESGLPTNERFLERPAISV